MTTSNATLTTPNNPPYRTLAIASVGVGAVLLVLSACALFTFIALPFMQRQGAVATNTAVLSLAAVFLGYGSILALVGWGVLRDKFKTKFWLPSPLIFVGLFVIVLLIGQLVLSLNLAPAHLFPFWHVLASLLVPLAVLAFAARRLEPASLRSVLAQFSWGGLVTILMALVFELIIGGVLVVLAFIGIAVVIGTDRLEELATALQLANAERALEILMEQPLAILIVAVAAVVLIVVIVPLLEELIKGGGTALLIARRQRGGTAPTKSEVILWGLAAGAGYAFTENMFNSQGSLTTGEGIISFWAVAMLLRGGTSLMHMIATATVALGWYYALVLNQRGRLVLFLLAAVAVHALWNTSALLLGGVSMLSSLNPDLALFTTALVGLVLILLIALFGGFLFWLRALVRWAQPPPVEIITPQHSAGLLVENAKEF